MDNACLKFELMGCDEPKSEPLLGYDYGYSPCVGTHSSQNSQKSAVNCFAFQTMKLRFSRTVRNNQSLYRKTQMVDSYQLTLLNPQPLITLEVQRDLKLNQQTLELQCTYLKIPLSNISLLTTMVMSRFAKSTLPFQVCNDFLRSLFVLMHTFLQTTHLPC